MGLETAASRPGGLNRYLEALVRAEREIGLDATAVVLGATSTGDDAALVGAAPVGRPMALQAWSVDRAVRRLPHPDVADLHFAGTAAITATVGALRRVPQVVHFQGPWAEESEHAGSARANVALKRMVERHVYRRARRCVTLSSAFAEVLTARYGVAPWSVSVLAPGVDLERFTPGDRDAARQAVAVGPGCVALTVRRLVPRMGLDVLLRAWAASAPGAGDVLAVVGDGPLREELDALARSLGVQGSVRFVGRVEDEELVQWYRAADLTVVPSVALEGYGLVVLESLACGTAVLGTDADGLAEALAVSGQRVVRAGDADALAEGLTACLGDGLAEARDGRAAARRRSVAVAHGWSQVAAQHEAVYADVLSDVRPVRVALLDHTAVLSGGELAIARAVGGLHGRAAVHAVLAEDGPLRARLLAAGASVEVLELAGDVRHVHRDAVNRLSARQAASTACYVLALARRLRALGPDVVHTNSLKSALYGGLAARLVGIPCVWHVRDRLGPPELPAPASRLVRAAARRLPTVVVANSASTLATVGVATGRVVPSPLDPSIVPGAPRAAHTGPLRCTILGRLAPWKGQHLAIEAFADAFGDGAATLRVVGGPLFGEDDYAATLAPLAASLGVAALVYFDGFVDDVAGVLADTDVVIHASLDPEPFGQVVIEAMGAGCAVLVADAGGPSEIVTDGVDGLLYARGDRAALAAVLRRVASDPALRAALGTAAAHAATAYTPSALAPRLLAAWDEARGRGWRARRRALRRG